MAFVISHDMQAQAFDYYARHKSVTLNAIALFLGVDRITFWRLRRIWNWPPRAEALAAVQPCDGATGMAIDRQAPPAPPAHRSLRAAAEALAHVTRTRLDALIGDQNAQAEIDHDRTARILAAYAKTLTIAQTLLDQDETDTHEPSSDGGPPRDLDELRDELAAHLERVVAEEEARGGDGLLV